MANLDPAVVAALIVSGATLLTVFANVASAHITRSLEKRDKEQSRLIEKQNKDAEEIVLMLAEFTKEFSDRSRDVEHSLRLTVNEISNWKWAVTQEVSPPESLQWAKNNFLRQLREFSEDSWSKTESFTDSAARIGDWFKFDALRLSLWFDEDDGIEETLIALGKKTNSVYLAIDNSYFNFKTFIFNVRYSVSPEKDFTPSQLVERAKEYRDEMEAATIRWIYLHGEMIQLQKTLIDRFKPSKTKVIYLPTQDGIFVKSARWLERKLRLLLQLS